MPTADELISPASIRELARVLNRAHPASQWSSVQAATGRLGPLGLSDRARQPLTISWRTPMDTALDG